MLPSLIGHSPDLKRLVEDGYELEVRSGHLLLHHVPYVSADRRVKFGILVSELNMAGEGTITPSTHVAMFVGEMPCDERGNRLESIFHSDARQDLGGGLVINFSFSSKPPEGYSDYYHKMTTYEAIISGPAQQLDPLATARTFSVLESVEEESVFHYADTASNRAGIGAMTDRLRIGPVGIVGLGGTGSYILDLVAKTPVSEIHLFDSDLLGQHNAFRSPGAASVEVLQLKPSKAQYFQGIYSNMRRNIFVHPHVDEETVESLCGMEFVFIAVDRGSARQLLVDRLEEWGIPFIDVGMGVVETDGYLLGQLRVTLSTEASRGLVRPTLPMAEADFDAEYARNIQIGDLNALNAALAVIKWKKFLGFYVDLESEHTAIYQIDGNHLLNEDRT